VTVSPAQREVKPNSKNRMNLCASPHPRQLRQPARGSARADPETLAPSVIPRFAAEHGVSAAMPR
jgi:hypothetical protein